MTKGLVINSAYTLEYDNINIISKGNYAEIYKGHLSKNEPTTLLGLFKKFVFRVKQKTPIDDDIIIKICQTGKKKYEEYIENEIECLLELKEEPHIIHIKKTYLGDLYKHYKFLCLENCKGGDLFNYFVNTCNGYINENNIKLILHQMIEAINECHKHGIVHGDIKLENIGLLHDKDISELRLLDFGGSYRIHQVLDNSYHSAEEFGLTASPHYVPPEIVDNSIQIREKDLIYTDLWELGIVTYVLLNSRYPFETDLKTHPDVSRYYEEYKKNENLIWHKTVSDQMKKFTMDLLKMNPSDRFINILN
jgi:serine/threonine protein kinase